MKINTFAWTVAAAATVVLAQPHHHKHRHAHEAAKRDESGSTVTEFLAASTTIIFVQDGTTVPASEACAGLADGQYTIPGGDGYSVCGTAFEAGPAPTTSTVSIETTSSIPGAAGTATAAEFYNRPSSQNYFTSWAATTSITTSTTPPAPTTTSAVPTTTTTSVAPAAQTTSGSGVTGINAPFPDGQISCSTFPSAYGAVYIDYLQLGGWIGLQAVTVAGNLVTDIVTGIAGQRCEEGMMCSYACPPGYQKSQWPLTQGATGQSVGGLSCSGGMLHLTNPSLSSSLCIPGVGGVQATNNAGEVVSICRTDYPGTESETVPTVLQAGQTQPLTCPDAGNYYMWEGKSTSAQYYLNPPGYGASSACQWGSPGSPLGNYAPINFGVGAKDGVTWLSIMSNTPTTTALYPGTVEITGNISGSCKYENGQYCSASGCNSAGCTVSLISGTATYVIS